MTSSKYSTIDYDHLVQKALKGVVRKVLGDVAKTGLPGGHHFYIAFRTDHPDVRIPDHLREKYPREITIVLQHQFWDLEVDEDHFQVALSFNQKPEKLFVPFDALTGFMDPSVQFGLQLTAVGVPEIEPARPDAEQAETLPPGETVAEQPAESAPGPAEEEAEAAPSDNVVTLDQFRKNAKP